MKLGKLLIGIVLVSLLVSMAIPMATAKKPPKPPPDEEPPADPAIAFIKVGKNDALMVMNADGTNQVEVDSAGNLYSPTWAPDGTSIAYTKNIPHDLYTIEISVNEGEVQAGEPTLLCQDIQYSIAWSPLGGEIAFIQKLYDPSTGSERPRLIQTISLSDGSVDTLYTADEGHYLVDIAWSPDGTEIAFVDWTTAIDGKSYINILTIDSEEDPVTVYDYEQAGIKDLDWSRSPDKLAFTLWPALDGSDGSAIYTLDLTQSNPTAQLVSGGESRYPSWSPDDSQQAFSKPKRISGGGRVSGWTVYIYDFGTEQTEELAKGWWPDWKR
ncbi:MAG: PD40 domain-containing protein [Thermoplasmata archaeon]|nr:MAG: PD40 domain-containing protein [Thermoplasmata archaeon]